MTKHAYEPLVPPEQIVARVPKELSAVIQRMMAKDADDRFQSMGEVIRTLEAWLGVHHAGTFSPHEEQISRLEGYVHAVQPRPDRGTAPPALDRLLRGRGARRRAHRLLRQARLGVRRVRPGASRPRSRTSSSTASPSGGTSSSAPASSSSASPGATGRSRSAAWRCSGPPGDAERLLDLGRVRADRCRAGVRACATDSIGRPTRNGASRSKRASACSAGCGRRGWTRKRFGSSSPSSPAGTGKTSSRRCSGTRRSSPPGRCCCAAARRGSGRSTRRGASRSSPRWTGSRRRGGRSANGNSSQAVERGRVARCRGRQRRRRETGPGPLPSDGPGRRRSAQRPDGATRPDATPVVDRERPSRPCRSSRTRSRSSRIRSAIRRARS